jgi:hypothetical protein
MLQAVVSSTIELVLGRLIDETSWVEIMNELTAKFWRLEELCSWLEGPRARICGLLLRPPDSEARWADVWTRRPGVLRQN